MGIYRDGRVRSSVHEILRDNGTALACMLRICEIVYDTLDASHLNSINLQKHNRKTKAWVAL